MNSLSSTARDVTIEYRRRDGSTSRQTHRIWDIDRFVAARQAEIEKSKNADKPQSSDIVAYSIVKKGY